MSLLGDILLFLGVTTGIILFPKAVGAVGVFRDNLSDEANTQEYSNADLDALARTLWGEARGEGYEGMVAVANVVMNRFRQGQQSLSKRRQFGASVEEVVKKPFQFSVWNTSDPNYTKILSVTTDDALFRQALAISQQALNGTLQDITGGADHYHTTAVNPRWADDARVTTRIGVHKFYDLA